MSALSIHPIRKEKYQNVFFYDDDKLDVFNCSIFLFWAATSLRLLATTSMPLKLFNLPFFLYFLNIMCLGFLDIIEYNHYCLIWKTPIKIFYKGLVFSLDHVHCKQLSTHQIDSTGLRNYFISAWSLEYDVQGLKSSLKWSSFQKGLQTSRTISEISFLKDTFYFTLLKFVMLLVCLKYWPKISCKGTISSWLFLFDTTIFCLTNFTFTDLL